jgi:hypothetical protein
MGKDFFSMAAWLLVVVLLAAASVEARSASKAPLSHGVPQLKLTPRAMPVETNPCFMGTCW